MQILYQIPSLIKIYNWTQTFTSNAYTIIKPADFLRDDVY